MIATMLGIDQCVANIIQKAAKYYYITTSSSISDENTQDKIPEWLLRKRL